MKFYCTYGDFTVQGAATALLVPRVGEFVNEFGRQMRVEIITYHYDKGLIVIMLKD